MSDRYSTDVVRVIFDDKAGSKVEVRPDRDGLGLVEVDGGDDYGRIIVAPALAKAIAAAIVYCASEVEAVDDQ